jgi:uroporphyrinogen-III synthase
MKINNYILSTAELDQVLISKAFSQGVEIDALSFIQVEFIKDNNLNQELADLCKLHLTAVFTSANAVNAISQIVLKHKPNWDIYCAGDATKTAVFSYFDPKFLKGSAPDAAGLVDIIKTNNLKEVLFFCGDKRLDSFPELLYQEEIMVHEIVVYKTKETPEEIKKHYQGILFFSPNGVNSFFRVNSINPHTVLFAVGNTTANAIKSKTTNKIIVLGSPSKSLMVDKVIEHFHK